MNKSGTIKKENLKAKGREAFYRHLKYWQRHLLEAREQHSRYRARRVVVKTSSQITFQCGL